MSARRNPAALRLPIACGLALLLLSGCATGSSIQFRFVDESTGKPLKGVTGQWNAIGGGSLFSRAIPVKTRVLAPSAENDALLASDLREQEMNHFVFAHTGYYWTIGDFSGGAFGTDRGQIMWPTNGVVVVPMRPEK